MPRSRGGKTSWENCVLASKEVNSRKADRLPEEAGLRLLKSPTAPRELPSTLFIRNVNRIPAWRHSWSNSSAGFLSILRQSHIGWRRIDLQRPRLPSPPNRKGGFCHLLPSSNLNKIFFDIAEALGE